MLRDEDICNSASFEFLSRGMKDSQAFRIVRMLRFLQKLSDSETIADDFEQFAEDELRAADET